MELAETQLDHLSQEQVEAGTLHCQGHSITTSHLSTTLHLSFVLSFKRLA